MKLSCLNAMVGDRPLTETFAMIQDAGFDGIDFRGDFAGENLAEIESLSASSGLPVATIYDWRVDGKGPRGIRIGRSVKFAVSDVRAWIDAHREPPASGEGR